MNKLLAIDSSTEACSAALLLNGELQSRYELAPRGHSQLLLPMVDSLLAQAKLTLKELDALAFGRGPGGFTGLRICVSAAQGLAFGAELPVLPVSSLQTMAQGFFNETGDCSRILTAIDARMNEVYWCIFDNVDGLAIPLVSEQVSSPESVAKHVIELAPQVALGSGLHYPELLHHSWLERRVEFYPKASDMMPLAVQLLESNQSVSADQALPVYLRNEVTWKKRQRLRT